MAVDDGLAQHDVTPPVRAQGAATQRMGAQAGRPVEFARHLYRASRYAFTTSFPRPEPVIG
jgi:hypothetical protein